MRPSPSTKVYSWDSKISNTLNGVSGESIPALTLADKAQRTEVSDPRKVVSRYLGTVTWSLTNERDLNKTLGVEVFPTIRARVINKGVVSPTIVFASRLNAQKESRDLAFHVKGRDTTLCT